MLGALAHGVPMLVLPQGADQWTNAEQVRAAGAGLRLLRNEVSASAIRHAVTLLLDEHSYRRASTTIQREIRVMPSAAEAMTRIEALIRYLRHAVSGPMTVSRPDTPAVIVADSVPSFTNTTTHWWCVQLR